MLGGRHAVEFSSRRRETAFSAGRVPQYHLPALAHSREPLQRRCKGRRSGPSPARPRIASASQAVPWRSSAMRWNHRYQGWESCADRSRLQSHSLCCWQRVLPRVHRPRAAPPHSPRLQRPWRAQVPYLQAQLPPAPLQSSRRHPPQALSRRRSRAPWRSRSSSMASARTPRWLALPN